MSSQEIDTQVKDTQVKNTPKNYNIQLITAVAIYGGSLALFFTEYQKHDLIAYIGTIALMYLAYKVCPANYKRFFNKLILLSIGSISALYFSMTKGGSRFLPVIYLIVSIKFFYNFCLTFLSTSDYKIASKMNYLINVICYGIFQYYAINQTFGIDITASKGSAFMGDLGFIFTIFVCVALLTSHYFNLNFFVTILLCYILLIGFAVYVILKLPSYCLEEIKNHLPSSSMLGKTFLIPLLAFIILTYESHWYCLGDNEKKKFKSINIQTIMYTVFYLVIVVGLFFINIYLNKFLPDKKAKSFSEYLKQNFKSILRDGNSIIILFAILFPFFILIFRGDTTVLYTMSIIVLIIYLAFYLPSVL